MFSKRLLVLLSLCALLLVAVFLGRHVVIPQARGAASVHFRDNLFTPSVLYIDEGTEVTFVNDSSEDFWPASDPHPVHSIYPVFDSKSAIAPGGRWSFTFSTAGTFAYHDHLSPGVTGTVVVGRDADLSSVVDKKRCMNIEDSEQQRSCWTLLLQNVIRTDGLASGLELFREIAPMNADDCHQFAHDLGKAAYAAYEKDGDIRIGEEASYCGYGFWHGFMNEMTVRSGLDGARKFCAQMKGDTPLLQVTARTNCYHGLGIGLIPDPPPQSADGHAAALIDPALRFCDTLPETAGAPNQNCYSGVFHGILNYMMKQQYGFSFDAKKPFALCFAQAEKYRFQCYLQIASKLKSAGGNDLARAYKLAAEITDSKQFESVFELMLTDFVTPQMALDEYAVFIQKCRSLNAGTAHLCATGVVQNLFDNGIPGKEYERALEVCAYSGIPPVDRKNCYAATIDFSNKIYSTTTVANVCAAIPADYRPDCAAL
ncbi:hypothetical protein K8R03_00865 [Candidatus Kaiserbacteria bacterium]|nr:hypothetical protein [Candidatus Kaiserbacteria bacterium]